jgi:hypothetical protein
LPWLRAPHTAAHAGGLLCPSPSNLALSCAPELAQTASPNKADQACAACITHACSHTCACAHTRALPFLSSGLYLCTAPRHVILQPAAASEHASAAPHTSAPSCPLYYRLYTLLFTCVQVWYCCTHTPGQHTTPVPPPPFYPGPLYSCDLLPNLQGSFVHHRGTSEVPQRYFSQHHLQHTPAAVIRLLLFPTVPTCCDLAKFPSHTAPASPASCRANLAAHQLLHMQLPATSCCSQDVLPSHTTANPSDHRSC